MDQQLSSQDSSGKNVEQLASDEATEPNKSSTMNTVGISEADFTIGGDGNDIEVGLDER